MPQQQAQAQPQLNASSAAQTGTLSFTGEVINAVPAPITLLLDYELTWIKGGTWQVPPSPFIPYNPDTPIQFSASGPGTDSGDLSAQVVYKVTDPTTNTELTSLTLTYNVSDRKSVPNQAAISVPPIYIGQVTGLEPWGPTLNLTYRIAMP